MVILTMISDDDNDDNGDDDTNKKLAKIKRTLQLKTDVPGHQIRLSVTQARDVTTVLPPLSKLQALSQSY